MSWATALIANVKSVLANGAVLPQRYNLNFSGSGVTVTDDPVNLRTNVAITGGGGSSQTTTALSNGLNSNVATGGQSSIRFGSYSGAVILGGLALTPAPTPGVPIDLIFTITGQPVTIRNLDVSSSAANQIVTGTGSDVQLPVGQAPRCRVVYDGTINKFVLQTSGIHQRRGVHLSDFGAVGDGVADDTTAFLNAIAAAPGGDIYAPVPSVGYKISSEISLTVQGTRLIAEGRGGLSVLLLPSAGMRSVIRVAASLCEVKGFFVYDTARQATYHFLRDGDAGSVWDSCTGYYAKLDVMHAAQIRNPTVSAVTQTGSGSGTIPTVTLYASPSEGLPYQIKCTTGGTISGGSVAFTIEANGDAGTLIGPFTVPADGFIQFPHFVGYGSASGMLVSFPPSATYASSPQDAFSWTIGGPDDLNGVAVIKNCVGVGAGQIFGTPAFLGANHYINYPADQKTSVSGVVLLTGGSQVVAGTGTAFLTTGARSNDFLRVGAFPNWTPNMTVPTGYLMTLGFVGGTPTTQPPGFAYVWEATTGGTTGGSAPAFPTVGGNPLGSGTGNQSPIGQTIVDNSVTWECICADIWQVLNVYGNEQITVQFHGEPGEPGFPTLPAYLTTGLSVVRSVGTTPPLITLSGTPTAAHTIEIDITTGGTYASTNVRFKYSIDGGAFVTGQVASAAFSLPDGCVVDFDIAGTYATDNKYFFQAGVDYALLVGSGYYEDSSGNNNTCVFENNNFNENASCGMALRCDYGHKFIGGQCTNNGAGAVAAGIDGEVIENLVTDHIYSEGNIVFGYWSAGVFGWDNIQPVIQDPNAHLMNPGDFSNGTWHGAIAGGSQDPQVSTAIGTSYSGVPATQSALGEVFTILGPVAKTSGVVTPVAATPIDVSVATGVGKSIIKLSPSGATTMTATPLLANGVEGQEVVLLNIGNYPITFTGSTYPTAVMFCEESVTLGVGDSVELRCIVNVQGYPVFWYQTGPVSHGVCVNGGQSPAITLANGMNSAVAIRGRKHLEISGPTGAFQISGLVPFASGDVGLGSGENGIPLELLYFGTQIMTLKHEDSSDESTAANRIWCPGGVDLVITGVASDFIYARLNYNRTQSRWIVKDHS